MRILFKKQLSIKCKGNLLRKLVSEKINSHKVSKVKDTLDLVMR